MRKLLFMLPVLLWACTQAPFEDKGEARPMARELSGREELSALSHSLRADLANQQAAKQCPCQPIVTSLRFNPRRQKALQIDLRNFRRERTQALLEAWSHPDSQSSALRFLELDGADSLDPRLALFSGVEELFLHAPRSLENLIYFPRLKRLVIFEFLGEWPASAQNLPHLQELVMQKCHVEGDFDFAGMPNLRHLYLSFSGFKDHWPASFEGLHCLQDLTLGAYLGARVDLSQLDLRKFPCLQQATFQTWYDALSGLPQGMLESNVKSLKVGHQRLNAEEKEQLEEFRRGNGSTP